VKHRRRIAVVSPFLDKRHGTERGVCEWVSRLADEFEIHLYSQRVEDIDLSGIHWHRIPRIPWPHLINYLWWFVANHAWRWFDSAFRDLRCAMVYSPGINSMDADVISVHIVFADLYEQKRDVLKLAHNSFWSWPKIIHRRLYYRLIISLEKRIYSGSEKAIIPITRKTAADLNRFYGRRREFPFLYPGIDSQVFGPLARNQERKRMREQLGLPDHAFVLLLVGNDWHNKGLPVLIKSVHLLSHLPIFLLVAGKDDPHNFREMVRAYGLENRVFCLQPRPDIIAYYAAADAYVGPSLADAFSQPIAEAMACGLPVIVSAKAGASEVVADGVNGLILNDPTDVDELAGLIGNLYRNPEVRDRMSAAAVATIRCFTWDQSASKLGSVFREVVEARDPNENNLVRGIL